MADFKMGSSRVGAEGGIALSRGLRAGSNSGFHNCTDTSARGEKPTSSLL